MHFRPRFQHRFFIVLMVFFSLCSYMFAYLLIAIHATYDSARTSDVIMILGEESYWGEAYNPCLVARVNHGVALYKQGYAPKLLMSGGYDENKPQHNEAETMKKIAIARGVPEKDILLEKRSTSTYENMIFSRPILQEHQLSSILLVTAPFHSPRAAWTAAKQLDQPVAVSPSLINPCWQQHTYLSRYMLREPVALIYYVLHGRL